MIIKANSSAKAAAVTGPVKTTTCNKVIAKDTRRMKVRERERTLSMITARTQALTMTHPRKNHLLRQILILSFVKTIKLGYYAITEY